jgi:dihydroorotate dehydrogenase
MTGDSKNGFMRFLYGIDPERAHRITIAALAKLPAASPPASDSRLAVTLAGLRFAHPVLLAAGFDKDAEAAHAIPRLGFAGGEVGTLTPIAQAGNPRPRLFRLVEDRAVINRMGFNNGGVAAAHARLARVRRSGRHGVIGVNIGANKDSADRVQDYVTAFAAMADMADYVTINISSPNTPGLRGLQDANALDALLDGVLGQRAALARGVPVFLKVAPDLEREDIDALTRVCIDRGIDAIIIGNTTISRPPLASRDAGQAGGLSGAPLAGLALSKLREFRSATGGAMPLIAAGGITSVDDVWVRLRSGASLVQIYSALVYAGPWLPRRIVRDLSARMRREGVTSIADIIDADNV